LGREDQNTTTRAVQFEQTLEQAEQQALKQAVQQALKQVVQQALRQVVQQALVRQQAPEEVVQ
jgi:hypothetical protein